MSKAHPSADVEEIVKLSINVTLPSSPWDVSPREGRTRGMLLMSLQLRVIKKALFLRTL